MELLGASLFVRQLERGSIPANRPNQNNKILLTIKQDLYNKLVKKLIYILFLLLFSLISIGQNYNVPEQLQSVTVIVDTPQGMGTGTLFNRKDNNGKDLSFVWTSAHTVVKKETFLFSLYGVPIGLKLSDIYKEVDIIKFLYENGKIKKKVLVKGELIKFSDPIEGEDLAIFQLKTNIFSDRTIKFFLKDQIPKIGETIYNIGNPIGNFDSFSSGTISFIGRNINNKHYDQINATIFGGSSGSGVFLQNGECIGFVRMMQSPGISFFIPIRRVIKWVRDEEIQWLLDPKIIMPTNKISLKDRQIRYKLEEEDKRHEKIIVSPEAN